MNNLKNNIVKAYAEKKIQDVPVKIEGVKSASIDDVRIDIDGTWYEISNAYGVVESGSCESDAEPNEILSKWLETHTVCEKHFNKAVFSLENEEYRQLQFVKQSNGTYWMQVYDDRYQFISELNTGCQYEHELKEYIELNGSFRVVKGLSVGILESKHIGNCSNKGISTMHKRLILELDDCQVFEAQFLTEVITLETKAVLGKEYKYCKPAYRRKSSHMAGGTFVYTSDSRFPADYPLSLHDRVE